MKIKLNLILVACLIDVVYLRRSFIYANHRRWPIKVGNQNANRVHNQQQPNFVTPSPAELNFDNFEQNQMVKQLINELTNNLHNKTLIDKIRLNLNEDEINSSQQLVSNLTDNLANRNPLMSEYLDEKLKIYLNKMHQQSLNQTIDLMDLLKQFNEIVSIPRLNLTNDEFELINKINRTELPNELKNKQDDFVLIYSKNSTDLNSTKLSRMEFLTDTLISLLIGKLIGLKIGFFAGKLISSVPFSFSKRGCCNTNTWPSDSPGMQPTDASIIRNQFISMKTNKDEKAKGMKNRTKKPTANDDDWLLENEEEDWKSLDEDEEEEKYSTKKDKTTTKKPTTKRPSINKQTKNKYSVNDESSSVYNKNNDYDKQIEESLEDLDDSANKAIFNFRAYTNYHPIYSTIDDYRNSQFTTISPINFIRTTNSLPEQTTTLRNHKNYMLLTG